MNLLSCTLLKCQWVNALSLSLLIFAVQFTFSFNIIIIVKTEGKNRDAKFRLCNHSIVENGQNEREKDELNL